MNTFTSKINYVVLDNETHAGLLEMKLLEATDKPALSSMIVGPMNGGMKVLVKEDGAQMGIYLSDYEYFTASHLPVENYLNKSLAPIGDLAAIVAILKPFL